MEVYNRKRRRILKITSLAIAIALAALAFITLLPPADTYADDGVFRVAYIEGDPYVNYAGNLYGLTQGLADLGLTDPVDSLQFAEGSDDAKAVWSWLGQHGGEKVAFVPEEFYQLIYMSDAQKEAFVRHMNEDGAVDLLLVMGTAAARFVRENAIKTDIMVMSVTNAYESGIVAGAEYSGIDNLWAHMSPNRYYNQLNVFHTLFGFKKLGIVYEDSENGRNEISYESIVNFAEEKGVTLVEEPVKADQKTDGETLYEEKMLQGYRSLAGRVDAVYMTNCGFRTGERIYEYVEPLYKAGVPVFSQTGKNDVMNGATLTIYRYSFAEIGSFCASRFLKILEGAAPGSLTQGYDEAQAICLNVAAAEAAGLEIPFKVLLSADTIFTTIGEAR